jgi:hypothetical protein
MLAATPADQRKYTGTLTWLRIIQSTWQSRRMSTRVSRLKLNKGLQLLRDHHCSDARTMVAFATAKNDNPISCRSLTWGLIAHPNAAIGRRRTIPFNILFAPVFMRIANDSASIKTTPRHQLAEEI